MSHTPYGYWIKNGKAFIDEIAAEKIRQLYKNYLAGLSLENAAMEAGIDASHGTVKRIMENRRYLGDDFYPKIIDTYTFTEAMLERERRMKALGRTDRIKPVIRKTAPVNFRFGEIKAYHDSPTAQAEYLYSLIESEETQWET